MRKQSLSLTGKKGNAVLDGILVLIVIFVFSIVIIGGNYVAKTINTDIQSDGDIQEITKDEISDLSSGYSGFFDNLFIFMLVLLTGFVVVASFVVDSHPLFFIFAIVLLVSLFFIAGGVSNAYEDIANTDGFENTSNDFPKTYFVMTHLVETLILITGLILLALYGKSRSGGF